MTNEEKLHLLAEASAKAFKSLRYFGEDDMHSEDLMNLLGNINSIEFMCERLNYQNGLAKNPVEVSFADKVILDPFETVEPIREETAAETQAPATISKEEVRDKLSTYSNKYDSLDVAEIMSQMGYSKLSEIPPERYGELLELVENSVKEGV